ncbi:hypothetical protein C4573_01300 [Candidatus Woesearchaeota archaeon]|nr:MAG: hypothetical protein C4573_01300 [Candidatus Woesearchaeota archaeon]
MEKMILWIVSLVAIVSIVGMVVLFTTVNSYKSLEGAALAPKYALNPRDQPVVCEGSNCAGPIDITPPVISPLNLTATTKLVSLYCVVTDPETNIAEVNITITFNGTVMYSDVWKTCNVHACGSTISMDYAPGNWTATCAAKNTAGLRASEHIARYFS